MTDLCALLARAVVSGGMKVSLYKYRLFELGPFTYSVDGTPVTRVTVLS